MYKILVGKPKEETILTT